MFGRNFKRKYALTDRGVKNTRKGAFWTVVVNLISMMGVGILNMLVETLMHTLGGSGTVPSVWFFMGLTAAFIVLSLITHIQQYQATYGLVYNEVRDTRLSLAERLQKNCHPDKGRKDDSFLLM